MLYQSKTKTRTKRQQQNCENSGASVRKGDRATEVLKQLGVEPNHIYQLVPIWLSHTRDLPLG